MVSRIKGAIAKEEMKAQGERDRSLILQYERFLYELQIGHPYVSKKEENKRKLFARLAVGELRRAKLQPIKRLAIVLASMLLLVIGGELVRREWLSGKPTDDEQQYVIQGNRIDTSIIQDGIADSDPDLKQITTKSYEEAVAFWGKEPTLPKWLPEGWEVYEYHVVKSKYKSRFGVSYQRLSNEHLIHYEETSFSDAMTALAVFEQNKSGDMREFGESRVYMLNNLKQSAGIWLQESSCYSLTGPLAETEIETVIKSIIGGPKHDN